MAFARFMSNLALALVVLVVVAAILFTFYGLAVTRVWEYADLERGAQGNWAWIDGQPLYYEVLGPEGAPWVVLLHDYDVGGSATWNATTPALLKAGMRVLAIDLKGFGHSVRDDRPAYSVRSQADLVARVLNPLDARDATVIGHGWGATVALQLAVDQPQFVARLALLAPVANETRVAPWRPLARLPYIGRVAAWSAGAGGPLWSPLARRCFANDAMATASYLRNLQAPGHVVGTLDALTAMARSPRDSDLPGALPRVQAPALVLAGELDRVAAPGEAEELADALPDATLVTIPEAGHALHVECSTDVNRILVAYALDGTVETDVQAERR